MARSPNYPGIGLPDAIERIRKIHAKAHTHKADAATIAKAAGFGGLNGAALTVLSALKKYGLLEEIGKEFRVSPSAMTIIADPVDSTTRREAVQNAAFSPALFQQIAKQFPGTAPSDELIRSFLIKKGFLAASVDTAIRAFRETMTLVTDEGLGYTLGSLDADAMLDELVGQSPVAGQAQSSLVGASRPRHKLLEEPSVPVTAATSEVGAYPVAKDCTIRLLATGPYTRKSIEALVKQLQLNLELDVFPHEQQTESQSKN